MVVTWLHYNTVPSAAQYQEEGERVQRSRLVCFSGPLEYVLLWSLDPEDSRIGRLCLFVSRKWRLRLITQLLMLQSGKVRIGQKMNRVDRP